MAGVSGVPIFISKTGVVYLRAANQAQAEPVPTAIVRPNSLSAPEDTLGNWTDSRISCLHLAATCFLVM